MKTRRPQGTREWGYRLPHSEYFVFVGTKDEAIAHGRSEAIGDDFQISEGRLTWREDERWDGLECNEDDEWFICIGEPVTIHGPDLGDGADREDFDP